jgi:Asp-tRNA(Asn)/Glu-tRNA(Gln) amidotransferase A subunit family amidase
MDISRRDFIRTSAGIAAYMSVGPTVRAISNGDDLAFLSISELSELIRTRKVSPVEVTRVMLQRIDKLNPILNAYITVTTDQAMKSAQDAEKGIQQGKWRGPLHGVPVALKDLFDTAGVRTTAASGVFKDRIPAEDAEVVRRLKAAGAVLLGKLNMHEFAFAGTSTVSYFGAVHNPWETTYSTGGSSGGSAAAVAAGLCFGALGSDTGGSIRQPAAYCGIVGLKPTYGLVSTRGVVPLSWSLDHVGPMTRTVVDAGIMLQAIAGYDRQEITSEPMTVPNYTATLRSRTSPLRLGLAHEFFFKSVDEEIEAATNEAISVLRKLTADVRPVTIPLNNITDRTVIYAEAYAYHAGSPQRCPTCTNRQRLQQCAQEPTYEPRTTLWRIVRFCVFVGTSGRCLSLWTRSSPRQVPYRHPPFLLSMPPTRTCRSQPILRTSEGSHCVIRGHSISMAYQRYLFRADSRAKVFRLGSKLAGRMAAKPLSSSWLMRTNKLRNGIGSAQRCLKPGC